MPPSIILRSTRAEHVFLKRVKSIHRRYAIHVLGVCLLLTLICIEFVSQVPQVDAQSHTSPTVNNTCENVGFSPDGNPFPLCPGSFPSGGNCVWWAWEQWHLLGYNLPLNWGNAADWIVDAERSGLPLGTTPRVGAIAVFPRADGVWAYGTPGHVAFVTSVGDDGLTFNVTYQNYGDPTPMYVGTAYHTPVINQARFQDGQMRFIYFPKLIDPQRFQSLPGIGTNASQAVLSANRTFSRSVSTLTGNRIALGSQTTSSNQEFNADFTGTGYSDLLLYNRQQGRLDVLKLNHGQTQYVSRATDKPITDVSTPAPPQVVSLADATTKVDKWGSSLDIHVGDFNGTGHSEILLYDRAAGTIQILSLTPQLTIQKHVVLSGWGPDWELYVGKFDGQSSGVFMYQRYAQPDPYAATPTGTASGPDLSGSALQDWEKLGRTANVLLLDFNKDFSVHIQQSYTLWHANWEVYVGHFVNAHQDGIFLYDRLAGEGRIMDFDTNLQINHYQESHNLNGNWMVYTGDFTGTGRAQLLLYDPGNGDGQMLAFASDLTIAKQVTYANLGTGLVPYVGHFGMSNLSAMLYNPQAGNSTFLAFDKSLAIAQQTTVQSWGQRWQVLVGAFLDRSRCLTDGNCSTGDDILVLDRQTGQIEQYVFSFGRKFQVYDNRSQAFARQEGANDTRLNQVDTTTFSLLTTLTTNIRDEELY